MVVRAAFDVKTTHRLTPGKEYNSDKEKYEWKHGADTTHYEGAGCILAVTQGRCRCAPIIWHGRRQLFLAAPPATYGMIVLTKVIVAVVSRWDQSTLGRDSCS